MILTTHIITGGAIGRLVPQNPLLAFILGFLSHFALDAIPHSGYRLKSFVGDKKNPETQDMILNKNFLEDMLVIGLDFFMGLLLCLIIFKNKDNIFNPSLSMISGALGGALPDALQFLYFKFRKQPLVSLQKIHVYIHRNIEPDRPVGWITQIIVVIAAVIISKMIIN